MLDIVRAIHRMHGKQGDTAERDAAQEKVDRLFTKLDTVSGTTRLDLEIFKIHFLLSLTYK